MCGLWFPEIFWMCVSTLWLYLHLFVIQWVMSIFFCISYVFLEENLLKLPITWVEQTCPDMCPYILQHYVNVFFKIVPKWKINQFCHIGLQLLLLFLLRAFVEWLTWIYLIKNDKFFWNNMVFILGECFRKKSLGSEPNVQTKIFLPSASSKGRIVQKSV